MTFEQSKANKKFMVLSALGIFMVVDSHCFEPIGLFGNFFPYNSFFMPMFIFISGYFNKIDGSTDIWKYTKKKFFRLILPYLVFSFIIFWLDWIFLWIKSNSFIPLTFDDIVISLVGMETVGSVCQMTLPLWFVPSLFSVLIIYAVLKKVMFKLWNSYIAFTIFSILSFIVVYLAKRVAHDLLLPYLIPLKCVFLLPFIEFGILYRDHFEKKLSSLSIGVKILLALSLLLINMIRTMYLPDPLDIAFFSLFDLSGFTSPYVFTPFISSIIGILFWVIIVDLIGKAFYDSKVINYISNNTFWIMGLQVVFFNILNLVLLFINNFIIHLPDFEIDIFVDNDWYIWGHYGNFKLVYLLTGITGPLFIKLIFDKIRITINPVNKISRSKN